MIELEIVEKIIFGLLSILGIFELYYSLVVLIVLIKHRKDKAPLTSYFLNPETTKIPFFVYAGIFGFLTGLMALIDYIDNSFNPSTLLQYTTFLAGSLFTILTAIFIVLALKFWYSRFKRFL